MTYSQTIDFLFNQVTSFQQVGKDAYKPGLERISEFMAGLGNPQSAYPTIHIAGTNGKGSVSHILSSVLQSAGYRVGLFTSPHLKDFRERIRLSGQMISEREVVDFVQENMPQIKRLGLSFFEITAALAFFTFARAGVDVAVIETGLGGRLDATNIITPELSVITNIGLDHTDLLGNTIEAVAAEKAGIIKRGIPVVIGQRGESSDGVFEQRAEALSAPICFAQDSYSVVEQRQEGDLQLFTLRSADDKEFQVRLDLLGEYQSHNVITATAAIDALRQGGRLSLPSEAYFEGFSQAARATSLVGRWQVLGRNPMVVCDTGHNAHGIGYVASQLETLCRRVGALYCVIGFAREKDVEAVLRLMPRSAYYIFTEASSPRALPAVELARKALALGLNGEVVTGVKEAVAWAQEKATEQDAIFIGGSNFVVAEIPFL